MSSIRLQVGNPGGYARHLDENKKENRRTLPKPSNKGLIEWNLLISLDLYAPLWAPLFFIFN
jgi:hypothetical protein